jgi:hypothetical protein
MATAAAGLITAPLLVLAVTGFAAKSGIRDLGLMGGVRAGAWAVLVGDDPKAGAKAPKQCYRENDAPDHVESGCPMERARWARSIAIVRGRCIGQE